MNFKLLINFALVLGTLSFVACDKNENSGPAGKYQHGVFIVHEGGFNKGTASVSYYNSDSMKVVNDIFSFVNNRALGDIAQSLTKLGSEYYIVVNNSNKVEIVDENFTSIGVIKDSIESPRYIVSVNDQVAYLSQWGTTGNGNIAVVNLSTKSVTRRISVGKGPEKILLHNNKAYVTNCGGFTNDSTISVIDISTNKVISTIKTACNPKSLVLDKNNKIWVLCVGGFWQADYSMGKTGALQRIDPATNAVETVVRFTSKYSQPSSLKVNPGLDNLMYIYDSKVYELSVASTTPVTRLSQSFYGLGVNPKNGDIYGANAGDYTTNGWVIRYDKAYNKVDSFKVGIIPSEIAFY